MTDYHSHILPAVDDGSKSIEISRELIKLELEQGVKRVILTPHQNKENLDKKRIEDAFFDFKEQVKDTQLEFVLGSEVYYYPSIKKDLKEGKIRTIDDTKYVLIEFSTRIETNIVDIIYDIAVIGFKPIVAHIERYNYLSLSDYDEIKRNGGLIQVNASSITDKHYKKAIKYLLKKGYIDFLGSDCHDLERRSVDFSDAKKVISKKYKEEYKKLFEEDFNFNA